MFTWCNRREHPHTVSARLDRACSDQRWEALFPLATVLHQHLACSDHAALWVSLDGATAEVQSHRKRRFRFEAAWVSSPECTEVIENAWGGFVADNPGKSVMDKIRATRVSLLQWNSSSFGNSRQTVKTIDAEICRLSLLPITTDRKAEIGRLRDKLEVWLRKEEILWKQRAKAHWLAAGDRNTSFFHSKANERRIHKEIKRIKDDKGEEVMSKEGIQQVILQYFSSIFRSTCPTEETMEEAVGCLEQRVTPAMNEALNQPFTLEEITCALKQMHPLKSPGPDGISPIFYQKYWSIVGPESAFIPGRLIMDNVLLAYELNHFLKQKNPVENWSYIC
ncbi:UNVERIFIED_CONTAM: LINE-1 retrotransposable element O protein [Sesamum latifolium]|uniref:LINE-1 retrotransposable element O protein n=1 Tax=Sesamum latifolium TaxID=2727402 RepID=A0AAW2WVA1_9LAMI